MAAVAPRGNKGVAFLKRFFPGGLRRYRILLLVSLVFLSSILGAGAALYFAPRLMFRPLPPASPPQGLINQPVGLPAQYTADSPVVTIARQVGPSVVGVQAMTGTNYTGDGVVKQGSGVIFDTTNGYIVTNNHVIAGAGRITVSLDREQTYPATLVGADERSDLAVLKVQGPNLPQARLGDSSTLQVGETVVAIGNPLGREFARSVTVGVISALNREVTVPGSRGVEITLRVLQTDAPINPGNSGGALVNLRGEIIGINSVKIAASGVEGMGFAIPINDVRPIIDQIITRGYVTHPFLGVYNLQEITPEMAQWYNIPVGVYVGGVFKDGPAAKAGLQVGDVITAVENQKVATYDDIQRLINKKSPGDQVTVTIRRLKSPNPVNYTITLGELPK
ncbi:serine protease Do-like HtrB [Moorella thermoacetica]|uniref:Serine protease Do-like HtrB n=2 Tax=Neomoorella thermoacetica TaxID=1525 RepID=A0A1J5NNF8_NEOTH|nr:serine protease Do-like HtrB [Moorella thermoacetica]AKX97901.1 serine protease Do-like HtrB [Moorella thermoacetica]OIQ10080.1 serine protease Do-like HtrB [Moorella thermoacetica]OIQ56732.1 serine protease Do-like HtrB [Moorella thermoacetica]OIQ62460.1 serine protease Do-like HtrB [Moorella thermoacetica]